MHSFQPIEYLDAGGDGYQHGGYHGDEPQNWRHAGGKHVVPVNNECHHANACQSEDHRFVSKDGSP